jgi:hypothetical protein
VDKPDELDLAQVASSISDGVAVDWARLRQSDSQATAVLREMALLDKIASFHRSHDVADVPTNGRRAAEAQTIEQSTWGHFRLIERIGEGTFGVVYRAWDSKLESEVALKLLQAPSRMLKEARNLARVRNPNVVTVYGTDLIDNRVGIWMEFVKGNSLADLLKTHGPFGAREAAGIGVDLCRALAAVHAAGLMHGDVKAHNVMRAAGGRTVLMDFGTGKELSEASDSTGQGTNDFAGTPLYVAPEVFDGQPRTRRSEIYSLGVLLYHLVTNEYPVEGRSRAELEQAHKRGDRKRLRDARPDLPEPFVYAVERAIAVDPKERYASAGAFEEALARLNSGGDGRPVPRPRTVQAMAAVLAGAIGVAGAGYWLGSRWMTREATTAQTTPVHEQSSPATARAAAVEPDYKIETAVYRERASKEQRLRPGEAVAPGDGLFVTLRVSVPAYVYIVNEDDQGESYLLFPLPGQAITNPLPSGITNRIPGTRDTEVNWRVTSAGGREHFLIFASPERQPVFEEMFASLPRPEPGRPVRPPRLASESLSKLRGVGGVTVAEPKATAPRLAQLFRTPLGDTEETVRGLWVRQLTVDNPK